MTTTNSQPLQSEDIEFASSHLEQESPRQDISSGLQRNYSVFQYEAFKNANASFRGLSKGDYLISDLLPRRSLGGVFGDSGEGKSSVLYQLALCVANGVPFIGYETQASKVLMVDYENGIGEIEEMVDKLCGHLNLDGPGDNFTLWTLNHAVSKFGTPGNTIFDIMRAADCDLIICDTFGAMEPNAEKTNTDAAIFIQKLRSITRARKAGTTVLGVHHLKKQSDKMQFQREALNENNSRAWLENARGPRTLINSIDVRIALDKAPQMSSNADAHNIPALVMGGFGRVRGEFPLITLARIYNNDGEPIGYERCSGIHMLEHPDMIAAFNRLPEQFSWTQAARIYGKGGGGTKNFLLKCITIRLLEKRGNAYVKTKSS